MSNIAVWGLGNHALRNLLPAIKQADSATLVGVVSRDHKKAEDISVKFDCANYACANDMLSDESVDTVLLAGPNGVHLPQGRLCLEAQKHLWVEKSLATSLEGAQQLCDLASQQQRSLCECFMFVYHAQFQKLREILCAGNLGRIVTISARFGFPHLDRKNIRYSSALGGGALLDAGAYCIATPLQLLDSDPLRVEAVRCRAEGCEVDTGGSYLMQFSGGVTALGDWGFGRSYRNEIDVWCEQGKVSVERAFSKPDTLKTRVSIVHADNSVQPIDVPADNHFVHMIDQFARCATNKPERDAQRKAALRQAQTVDLVVQSSQLLGD